MNIGSKGIDLIKSYEGCRLEAYLCPAGVWTIGWGHTKGVYQGQTITQAQADEVFLEDIKVYSNAVDVYNSKFKFNQNEFDALTSFAYNCGVGSLANVMACCNTKKEIAEECKLYNKGAGGVVLPGLVRRREEEYQLFIGDIENEGHSEVVSINADTYTVQAGDTLSAIASRFNTTVDTICKFNNISDANIIYIGQVLKLEGEVENTINYIVKSGDTLSSIAAAYGTTWQAIATLNGLRNPNIIYEGQNLRVN